MPSLMVSGVSPFHHTGAGSDTSTVIWPGLAGLATGIEPFWPVISQLPVMFMAAAGAASPIATAAAAAIKVPLLSAIIAILLVLGRNCFGDAVYTRIGYAEQGGGDRR